MNQDIDKKLIKERFSKATQTYTEEAVVQKYIAEKMNQIIKDFIPEEKRRKVLEIGCGTGLFTRIYLKGSTINKLIMNDICDEVEQKLSDILGNNISFLPGDAESINLPVNMDMIVSCSAIQWFNNPIDFLNGCRERLSDSGVLAISTFAPDNFNEISTVCSSTLNYIPEEKIRQSLEKYYDIIYIGEEKIPLYFKSPEDVLKHLKKTGVNGIKKEKWTRSKLNDFILRYKELFSMDNDMVTLTYNPIYIICKKKKQ